MGYGIGGNIYTISDLKTRTKEIRMLAKKTGEPIIITVNGKPDLVLMCIKAFNEKIYCKKLN